MRALTSRLALVAAVVAALTACPPPAATEGEGEASEGEGDVVVGEGEGDVVVGEGEGDVVVGEGEGEGDGPVDGFDVSLDVTGLEASLKTSYRNFAAGDCEVAQDCVAAAGNRALLSAEIVLRNNGTVVVNSPAPSAGTCGGNGAAGLITARLVNRAGEVALEQDFDIADFGTVAVGGSVTLTTGPCALLDITDVTPGDYQLELALHSGDLGADQRASNDVVSATVVVVSGLACPDNASICGGVCCPQGVACTDGACILPDIFVDEQVLFDTVEVQEAAFSADSCAIVEGCVDAPGNRRLMRFSTTTPNEGNADLVMGRPRDRPDLFTFSDCHGHFHFDQYADYRLLDADGNIVSTGHKQAFCLIDLDRRDPDSRRQGQFGCSFDGSVPQGISMGWADTYNSGLDCQWIDITGVAEGNYTLEVHVNPQHIFPELDLMNNVARVPVFVPADPNACVPNPNGEICHNGDDDDCDGSIDEDCAPITTADSCQNGFSLDNDGLVLGTITADNASDSAPSCGGAGGEFVVHFNVAADGLAYLSTYGSEIDTTLSIFRGADCQPTDEVFCSDDGCVDHGGAGGAHFLGDLVGSAYTAVVKAKDAGASGRVQLKLQKGDCVASALAADVGENGDVEGTVDGGRDSTSPTCLGDCDAGGRDQIWYFATCPGDTAVRVTTCGPGVAEGQVNPGSDNTFFDSILELREDTCLGDPVPAACSDDVRTGQIRCSEVETVLTSNGAGDGLYFALVDGCGPQDPPNARGGYELHLTQTQQP